MNALTYDPSIRSAFIIIDRNSKRITEIEAEAFVCLHAANAYEQGSELILDLVCYQEGNPYQCFYLDPKPVMPNPELKRYIIDLNQQNYQVNTLASDAVEFPRMNYLPHNGQSYHYLYTVAKTSLNTPDIDAIRKFNVQTGKTWQWSKVSYYPAEPIFIPKPNAKQEDDGVVLVIAFNANTQKSVLVILNAEDMQQIAEIALPFHTPIGLHGNFYRN